MSDNNVNVLKKFLADTFSLYLKTLNYHWNIRRTSNFFEFHKLLESQYNDLAEAADVIAEKISIYGDYAPATFSEYQKLSTITEGNSRKSASEMIEELYKDNVSIYNFTKENQDKVDFVISDLLTNRAHAHTKASWMLKSSLQDK